MLEYLSARGRRLCFASSTSLPLIARLVFLFYILPHTYFTLLANLPAIIFYY
jgi:hypothetical protein